MLRDLHLLPVSPEKLQNKRTQNKERHLKNNGLQEIDPITEVIYRPEGEYQYPAALGRFEAV